MSGATHPWHALAAQRIYFGHQSVGQNILDGVRDIASGLRIAEGDTADVFIEPGIAHSRIGKNHDPRSKIAAFAATMRHGLGDSADIAFLKLCYVDVTAATDVQALFAHYADTMAQLRAACPGVTFVHVTVPLTVAPPVWRLFAGRVLNRPVHSVADNIARNRYNDLLRQAYTDREPLFDLARYEVNGRSIVRGDPRGAFWALDARLTDDGGHLHAEGRRLIARALLADLARIAQSRRPQVVRRAS